MISKDLLKGTLKTIVLNLLSDGGRMYGYEITREVEKLSEGTIKLSWGALYPTLHKLEADGLIYAEEESTGRRVRKYYQLTPEGTEISKDKVEEFLEYVRVMSRVLKPTPGLNLNYG